MPVTWLDILLLVIMLVSGVFAMIRGFMREVLAIAAWLVAAVATVLLYERLLPIAEANIGSGILAKVAVAAGVFLVTLLVVSLITMRVSDLILDSHIGALDRTLGFLFGLARGLLIVVVAFLLFTWFVPANKLPEGVRDAKSRAALQWTGQWLQSLLLEDMDTYLSNWLSSVFKRQPQEEEPEAPEANRRSDLGGAGAKRREGYPRSDRGDMRQLIDGARR